MQHHLSQPAVFSNLIQSMGHGAASNGGNDIRARDKIMGYF